MKKSMKKILSLVFVVVLAMSFVACGSKGKSVANKPEKITTVQLVEKMEEALKEVKGAKLSSNVDLKVKANINGNDMDITAGGSILAEANESKTAHVKADFDMNLMGQSQDFSMEAYQVYHDDKVEQYLNLEDKWTYEETDLEDITDNIGGPDLDSITSMLNDADYSKVLDFFDLDSPEIKGNEYSLVAKLDYDKFLSLMEEYDVDTFEIAENVPDFEITLTMNVSAKSYLPTYMSLDVKMDTLEIEQQSIEIIKCLIEFEFDSFDAVEIDIPKEALEAKE